MTDRQSIRQTLIELIEADTGEKVADLGDSMKLKEELGLDSVDVVEDIQVDFGGRQCDFFDYGNTPVAVGSDSQTYVPTQASFVNNNYTMQLDFACGSAVRRLAPKPFGESWWRMVRFFTRLGPLGQALRNADEALRQRVIGQVQAAFGPFVRGGEVRFTAACWLISTACVRSCCEVRSMRLDVVSFSAVICSSTSRCRDSAWHTMTAVRRAAM